MFTLSIKVMEKETDDESMDNSDACSFQNSMDDESSPDPSTTASSSGTYQTPATSVLPALPISTPLSSKRAAGSQSSTPNSNKKPRTDFVSKILL